MADLPESATFDAGVYQIETTDAVVGGADGKANASARNLANRTIYLKQQVDALGTVVSQAEAEAGAATTVRGWTALRVRQAINVAVAAVVNSAPSVLDTLSELAAALGNDANFATTITTALAAKAPLASPALTGNPTAPTAAVGDNDSSIANTEFVQSELINYAKLAGLSTQPFSAANASGINNVIALGQILGNFSPSGFLNFPFWDGSQLRTGIFQWTQVVCATGGVVQGITLPIAFPNAISQVYGCATGTNQYAFATAWTTLAAVQGSNNQTGGGIAVFAIGY